MLEINGAKILREIGDERGGSEILSCVTIRNVARTLIGVNE